MTINGFKSGFYYSIQIFEWHIVYNYCGTNFQQLLFFCCRLPLKYDNNAVLCLLLTYGQLHEGNKKVRSEQMCAQAKVMVYYDSRILNHRF